MLIHCVFSVFDCLYLLCLFLSENEELGEDIVEYGNEDDRNAGCDQVGIEGRLQTRNYTNREGKKVYVTEIIVENVEFLQSKKQGEPHFEELDPSDDLPF